MNHKNLAKEMLESVDAFMAGEDLTPEQDDLQRAVFRAGCYAAAAYDAHLPKSGGEAHSLTRAFLLALFEPLHPELDYLRADPSSGDVARDAMNQLNAIVTP